MPGLEEDTRSVGDAKAHFAECVREVEKGQTVVLTRHGRPVAKLVPIGESEGVAGQRQERSEVHEQVADYEARELPAISTAQARRAALMRLLEKEVWPQIPHDLVGNGPTKKEREQILGLGEDGS